MLTLKIATDNAAFADDLEGETANLLIRVAKRVRAGEKDGRIVDTNGNVVGQWELS